MAWVGPELLSAQMTSPFEAPGRPTWGLPCSRAGVHSCGIYAERRELMSANTQLAF